MTFGFHRAYALAFLLLLAVLVAIALFVHDAVVRPFGGDVLVVWLIAALARTFVETSPYKLTLGVLLFAYAIEVGQGFHLVDRLGLGHLRLARIVIGASFDPLDLVAYTLGAALLALGVWSVRHFHGKPCS